MAAEEELAVGVAAVAAELAAEEFASIGGTEFASTAAAVAEAVGVASK